MDKNGHRLQRDESGKNDRKSGSEITSPLHETETDLLASSSSLRNSFLRREKERNQLDLLE